MTRRSPIRGGLGRRSRPRGSRPVIGTVARWLVAFACAAAAFPVVAAPSAVDTEVVSSLPPAPPGPGNQGPTVPELGPSAVVAAVPALVPPSSRPRPRPEGFPTPSSLPPDRIERPPQLVV